MADIRIKDLPTTATQTSSDDFIALDGTVNGTRKLSAYNPSFGGAITGVSLTAPTITNLTLAGGSTGASLVLGQGANANATITPSGTGKILSGTTGSEGGVGLSAFSVGTATGLGGTAYRVSSFYSTAAAAADRPGVILGFDTAGAGVIAAATQATGQPLAFWTYNGSAWGEKMRLATTGNLLIGTTTDGGQKLQVNGTASFAGAVTGASTITSGYHSATPPSVLGAFNAGIPTSLQKEILVVGDASRRVSLAAYQDASPYVNWSFLMQGTELVRMAANPSSVVASGTMQVFGTTSASSSIAGSFLVGNGTAATNVAIGGGNINAGGTGTFAGAVTVNGTGIQVNAAGFGSAPNSYYAISSAQTLSGNGNQAFLNVSPTFNADAAGGQGNVLWVQGKTAASYTLAALAGLKVESPSIGAGGAVTTVYGLRIQDQTGGATNYAIATGAGRVSFGDTTPSTGAGSGALQVAGGIYSGAASVIIGQTSFGTAFTPLAWGTPSIDINGASGGLVGVYYGGTAKGYFTADSASSVLIQSQSNGTVKINTGGTGAVTLGNATGGVSIPGAATFAGAVSVNSVTPSTGAGSGALQVAGGIYAGATSYFGGDLNVTRASAGLVAAQIYNSTSGTGAISGLEIRANNHTGIIYSLSDAFTSSGQYLASGTILEARGSAGLMLSGYTSGPVKIWAANGLRATFDASAATFAGAVTTKGSKLSAINETNVSTTPTDIAIATSVGGLYFVTGYNTSGGNQCTFLLMARGTIVTTVSSDNNTGLTITFSMSSGKLQAATASGTVALIVTAITR